MREVFTDECRALGLRARILACDVAPLRVVFAPCGSVSGEWLLEVFLAELAERALSRGARATAGLRPRRRERQAPARRVAADARPHGGPRLLGVRRSWLSVRDRTAAPARARARAVP